MVVLAIERSDARVTVDAPTGRDDWLVINNEGMLYPLPDEFRAYDIQDWWFKVSDKPYKNLRIKEPTWERLKQEKRDYETWDGFMHRALNSIKENEQSSR